MLKVRLITAFTLLPIVLLIFTIGPEWGTLLFLMAVAMPLAFYLQFLN